MVTVASDDHDIRLDRWFKRHYPALGHGRLEKLLRTGQVRIDGGRAKAAHRISTGQTIRVPPGVEEAPAQTGPAPVQSRAESDFIRAMVLYRDDDVVAINKPSGLAVQGGSKITRSVDHMLDALRFEAGDRPRLVHRLDKDTSGVLALARTRRAAARLTEAFKKGRVEKTYWALVAGVPSPPRGMIDLALAKRRVGKGAAPGQERVIGDDGGGREARTAYEVVAEADGAVAWLSLVPETGRTHQIRVHCQALGTPILGDRKYGGPQGTDSKTLPVTRLMLHARRLILPGPDGIPVSITAPLDAAMQSQWEELGFTHQFDRDIESFTAVR